MKRRGFTLIELMVVIALIAILSTLLVIGIAKMQTNGKRQQTRLIMQNLSAMFADYDVHRQIPFGMGTENFNSVSNQSGLLSDISMPAPGDVTANGTDRTGLAVQITRSFMAQLMTVPSNATAIGKLPSNSLMTFAATNLLTGSNWDNTTPYKLYGSATDAAGSVYVRTVINPQSDGSAGTDGAQNAPPNPYYWMPALPVPSATVPLPTPVMLDAWGNPIIFVMGGALSNVTAGGQSTTVHSPDFHPFFASAGPDGNFSQGDDNLYSFEK